MSTRLHVGERKIHRAGGGFSAAPCKRKDAGLTRVAGLAILLRLREQDLREFLRIHLWKIPFDVRSGLAWFPPFEIYCVRVPD